MRYVIVDLEATCWETGTSPNRMEIIEIGAVMLDSALGPVSSEFAAFVRPVASQHLSDFCTQLTSIRQQDVDTADYFWAVFPRFVAWIGEEPFRLCSWGAYDLNQFRKDCERHNLMLPVSFENHINLKKEFSRLKSGKLMGMNHALTFLKLPLEGTHHRGIDDARNIANIAQILLPQIEADLSKTTAPKADPSSLC